MSITMLNAPRCATPAIIVPHQAWRQSRSALLEAACTGPATLALLGAAGTGKSWLLRHLETTLRKHGQAVTLLRQGDLPWQLTPGTVLLIDEASRLNERALATLVAQRTTIVILADLPKFGDTLARQVPPPPIVHLHAIHASQVADFVANWLRLADREPQIITASAIGRLAVHSSGTPRLITGLLNAALALSSGSAPVTGAVIDEVATLRWSGGTALPSLSEPRSDPTLRRAAQPAARTPKRSRARRAATIATFTAVASASLLTLRSAETAAPRPSPAIVAALVPPPSNAALALVVLAKSATPELASQPAPPSFTASPITLVEAAPASLTKLPLPPAPQTAMPSLAATTYSSELPIAEPDLHLPAASDPVPGLILIARRGDTLRELYASLYRGVEAPPYEDVVAVNPKPVVPGTVVIFPAPPGGWPRR